MAEHGPGVTWLAARAGCTAAELLADPRRLVAALAEAGRAASDLTARLTSDDVAVRAAAEAEAEVLRRGFAEAPDPADRLRAQVLTALREATARVRSSRPAQPGA